MTKVDGADYYLLFWMEAYCQIRRNTWLCDVARADNSKQTSAAENKEPSTIAVSC